MAQQAGQPADPCVMVTFGASGDLTKRKLVPALFNLHRDGLLSDEDLQRYSRHIIMQGAGISAYPLVAAAQDAAMADTLAVVNTSFLNVRSGAGVQNDVVSVVAGGNELRVIGASGSWLQVETNDGTMGWVSRAYVVVRGPMVAADTHG